MANPNDDQIKVALQFFRSLREAVGRLQLDGNVRIPHAGHAPTKNGTGGDEEIDPIALEIEVQRIIRTLSVAVGSGNRSAVDVLRKAGIMIAEALERLGSPATGPSSGSGTHDVFDGHEIRLNADFSEINSIIERSYSTIRAIPLDQIFAVLSQPEFPKWVLPPLKLDLRDAVRVPDCPEVAPYKTNKKAVSNRFGLEAARARLETKTKDKRPFEFSALWAYPTDPPGIIVTLRNNHG